MASLSHLKFLTVKFLKENIMKLTYREIHKLIDKGIKLKVKTPDGYEYVTDKFVKKDSGYKITYNDETSTICAQTHDMQFNGKLKATVKIARATDESTVKELVHANPTVINNLQNKTVIKEIYVKNKIYNIVVK